MKMFTISICLAAFACGSSEPASKDAPAAIVAELEQLATEACACAGADCSTTMTVRYNKFLERNQAHVLKPNMVGAMVHLANCMKEVDKREAAATPPVAPDAGVATPPPAPPIVDAAPAAPPPPAHPSGVTDKHLAALDAMLTRLQTMSADVTAAADCAAAAAVVTRSAKGFKPVKKVLAEVNPKNDPEIADWLLEAYFRPAFGAVGTLVNKGIEGCDEDDAWNKAVEASDFMGTKKAR